MTFARVVACVCSTRLRLFQTTMRTCFFCRGVADVMGLGALQSSRAAEQEAKRWRVRHVG